MAVTFQVGISERGAFIFSQIKGYSREDTIMTRVSLHNNEVH